jgi:hypothetical protein
MSSKQARARHRSLVVLVGAEHVEEFQAHPLRRQLAALLGARHDRHVEQVLAPAIKIHRAEPLQRRQRLLIAKALRAVSKGCRRRGIDQRRRGRDAPIQKAHREIEIGLDDEVAVRRRCLRDRAEMNEGVEMPPLQPALEFCRRHESRDLALGEVSPLALIAEEVADGHVSPARVIERVHHIRPDKAGTAGHQQHSIPRPDCDCAWD